MYFHESDKESLVPLVGDECSWCYSQLYEHAVLRIPYGSSEKGRTVDA